ELGRLRDDPTAKALLAELREYVGPLQPPPAALTAADLLLPVHIRRDGHELRMFITIITLGTAQEGTRGGGRHLTSSHKSADEPSRETWRSQQPGSGNVNHVPHSSPLSGIRRFFWGGRRFADEAGKEIVLLPLSFSIRRAVPSRLFLRRRSRYHPQSHGEAADPARAPAADARSPGYRSPAPAGGPAPRHPGVRAGGLRRIRRAGDAGAAHAPPRSRRVARR